MGQGYVLVLGVYCSQSDIITDRVQTALKLLDPSITLILCGKDGYSDWDRYTLQQCITDADMHSIHLYTSDAEYVKRNVFRCINCI
jgi:hypothetical protein